MEGQLALPPPPKPARLIVLDTRLLVKELREGLTPLGYQDYDLNEIGMVVVESLDQLVDRSPDKYTEMRNGFADHFARMVSSEVDEYGHAYGKFFKFFDGIAEAVNAVDLEKLGNHSHLGITFWCWTGGDLVVNHHPLPY